MNKVLELDDGTLSTGWNTKADGSGTSYQAGDKINLNENTTLYAQWPAAQKIMDTAAAVEAIGKMEQGKKLELTLGGEIDLSQLKDALTQAKGTVSLDLSQAEGLTTIGAGAFQGITALTSVTLPEEVTSIGANAFAGSGLTSITLQEGLLSIGDNAFKGTKLSAIQLPQSLTTIGSGAFSETTNLASNVSIPASVTEIKANAFAGSGLTSITLESSAANITIDNTAIPSGAGIAVPPTELEAYTQKFPTYRSQFTGFVQYRVSYLFETTDGSYVPATSAGVSDSNGIYQDKQVSGIPGQQTSETAPAAPTGFMDGQVVQQVLADDGSTVVEVKYERKTVTITINSFTGAGTSGLSSTYTGKYGADTNISPTPPANFTFVKWVDNSGSDVTIPTTFPAGDQTIEAANALYTNAAGHPVYPAYLTVQRKSYTEAENDDVGQEKPDWAGKIYSQQLVKRPISDPVFTDAFKFGDGSSQIPQRGTLTVTTGDQGGEQTGATTTDRKGGSFRIPAMTSIKLPSGTNRIFAAMDMRYRGREDGNGDCGTDYGASDFLVMYSDDGGATWTKKVIDVDNTWSETGQANPMTRKTDIGDPALWTVGTDVYVGGVGGSAISGGRNSGEESTTRVFKSSDYGETWVESTNISQNRYTYAYMWNTIDGGLTNPGSVAGYANLPCPGHGIVLTKDVPGTPMKAGMTAVPMQGGKTNFHCYMAYGNGDPRTWSKTGTAAITEAQNNGEWQMCQLDDGTILGTGKTSAGNKLARYKDNTWNYISTDVWKGRGLSQVSILKVMDGNDSGKYGIVAFTSPKTGGQNNSTDFSDIGRNQITVSFARDISKEQTVMTESPLGSDRYYVQIRKMGQRYFGYTDMVMVNDEVIGVLYECFDKANDNLDGMRFIMIDTSEIIKKLSAKSVQ